MGASEAAIGDLEARLAACADRWPSLLDGHAIEEVVALVRPRLPLDYLAVSVLAPDGDALRAFGLWASERCAPRGRLPYGARVPIDRSRFAEAFAAGGCHLVADVDDDEARWVDRLGRLGLRSYAAIGFGAPPRGLLCAGFVRAGAARRGQLPALRALARVFATRVEQALRLARLTHLEGIRKVSPDPVVLVAADGTVRDANPAAERLWQLPVEELLGRRLDELLRPRGRGEALEQAGTTTAAARVAGRSVPVEAAIAVHAPTGTRHIHLRDLRPVRQLEAKLRHRDRELRLLTEVARAAANPVGFDGAARRVLGLLTRLLPARSAALVRLDGERLQTIATGGDAGAGEPAIQRPLVERARRTPRTLRDPDGRSFYGVPLLVDGERRGLLVLGARPGAPLDGADRKLVRVCADALAGALAGVLHYEATQKQGREHRALLENLPVVVFRGTLDGDVVHVNAGVEAILGYTPEEVRAPGLPRSLLLDEPPPFAREIEHHLATGAPIPWLNVRLRHKLGHEVLLRCTLLPVRDGRGDVVAFEGIAADVTAERETQRQLMAADRLAALGLLAAGIGHEINNPAAFVLLGVQQIGRLVRALRDGRGDGASAEPHLARMERILGELDEGVRRIAAIVSELRRFARSPDAPAGSTDVNGLLRSAAALVGTELRSRARMELDLGDVPPQPGRYQRLSQVFLNLLINAAQAIPAGDPSRHRVRVDSRCEGGELRVRVHDTGPGIAPELLPRVFDPFFTTKPPGEGTGLGLAISFDLVKQLGGRLDVDSRPGQGCTFTVSLPSRPACPSPPPPEERPRPRRGRVLVVDDEPAIAVGLSEELESCFTVEVALSGDEAQRRLEQGWFDAVLCDMRMPGVSGCELYRRVRARDRAQAERFLFVTGAAAGPDEAGFLAQVGQPVLEKPFALEELWSQVARVVGPRPE